MVYKNHYTTRPSELQPDDRFAIKVVAVVGSNGDWTAYFGPTEWSDDAVAAGGDKIPQRAAENLFVVCRYLKWRD